MAYRVWSWRFEAALEFGDIAGMADRASLFKYVVKSVGTKHGVTPCFMAKPKQGLPGNSGHMHVSVVDKNGKNLFARDTPDDNAPWKDIAGLSDLGRHFLAGILEGLPDIMPILAPTINSYKRLVENFWAPVTVSWGLEHRAASIRLIAPPTASAKATRFEIRTPGADTNPPLVLAAILGLGERTGVEACHGRSASETCGVVLFLSLPESLRWSNSPIGGPPSTSDMRKLRGIQGSVIDCPSRI